MKFRKVQLELIRKELEESDFYEDIMFANDEVKERTQKNVANWIVSLRISGMIKGKIKKLKQLFCKVEEINFPIIINESMDNKLDFEIVDKNEKRYYFYKNDVNKNYREVNNIIYYWTVIVLIALNFDL